MLCSSGGHFAKTQGGTEYQGGETRLVSVSNYCHMQELQDALHRVSQTMRLDLSNSSGSVILFAGYQVACIPALSTCQLQAATLLGICWLSCLLTFLPCATTCSNRYASVHAEHTSLSCKPIACWVFLLSPLLPDWVATSDIVGCR